MPAAFDRFLRAYNAGSQDSLAAFYAEEFAPDFVEERFDTARGAARERRRLLREYGPLRLYGVDTEAPTTVFWARGTVTGGWLGFEYSASEEHPGRIGRSVLWRLLPGHHGSFRALEGQALRDSLHAYLSRLEREDYFSGVVLVTARGETLFEGAYGLADREREIPNTPKTRFNIASSGKMLTGTALLRLAQAGVVELDDALGEWVPEYPSALARRVRLEDLLTHTSGIELDEIDGYREALANASLLEEVFAAQMAYVDSLDTDSIQPGARFDYTNEGVDLAGIVIQRASGRSWEAYLSDRVLEPADMRATAFDVSSAGGPVATGYALESTGDEESPERVPVSFDSVRARPAGQLVSTAGDLARFVRSLLDGRLLESAWVERMTSAQVSVYEMPRFGVRADYGYTMQLERRGPVRWFGHAGGIPAGGAQVRHYPDVDRTVVVLSNLGGMAAYIVAGHIEELVAGTVR